MFLLNIISVIFNKFIPQSPVRAWDQSRMCEVVQVSEKCLSCKTVLGIQHQHYLNAEIFLEFGGRRVMEKRGGIQGYRFPNYK